MSLLCIQLEEQSCIGNARALVQFILLTTAAVITAVVTHRPCKKLGCLTDIYPCRKIDVNVFLVPSGNLLF